MRNLISISLAVAACASLGACSEGEDSPDATSAGTTTAGEAATQFGESVGDETADDVIAVVKEYNRAMATGDGPAACAVLSDGMRTRLEKKNGKPTKCAKGVLGLVGGLAPKDVPKLARAQVTDVRVADGQVLAFYTIPDTKGRPFPYPMRFEDGRWTIGLFDEKSNISAS